MSRIRVLLAEDHQVVREGLRCLLEREEDMEVVGEAESGEMACEMARLENPDVIVMDIGLKGMDGLEATKRIKSQLPSVHVLALSMYTGEEHVYGMLREGADGYIIKHAAARELTWAVRTVFKGESILSPSIARKVIAGFRERSSYLHSDDILSAREREILVMMARWDTSRDIAGKLCLSPKTVDNHRARIIEKLHARNRVEAVMNAVNLGIISRSEAQVGTEARN